jgi:hypothetical protein
MCGWGGFGLSHKVFTLHHWQPVKNHVRDRVSSHSLGHSCGSTWWLWPSHILGHTESRSLSCGSTSQIARHTVWLWPSHVLEHSCGYDCHGHGHGHGLFIKTRVTEKFTPFPRRVPAVTPTCSELPYMKCCLSPAVTKSHSWSWPWPAQSMTWINYALAR